MKIQPVTLNQLKEKYIHPSIYFFRAIELRTLFEVGDENEFRNPALDLGCGDGFISSILFDEIFYVGLDNGEGKDVEIAIQKNRYKKVILESAENISLAKDSLEFLFSNSVLEHIPPIEAVLSEAGRILKKGGKFLFTVPSSRFGEYLYLSNALNLLGLNFLAKKYAAKRNELLNHYHCYGHEEWIRRLKCHGIKVISYRYYLSKKALMLWDKMALQCFLGRAIGRNVEKSVGEKYKSQIENLVSNDTVKGDLGACVLILGKKI